MQVEESLLNIKIIGSMQITYNFFASDLTKARQAGHGARQYTRFKWPL